MKISSSLLRKIIKEEIEALNNIPESCGHCDNGIRFGSHNDEKPETYCTCPAGMKAKAIHKQITTSKSELNKFTHERY